MAMEQPVDLGQIWATTHHGCMGLPRELVDHVMDMLYDDIPALKACSLTCKAIFASTRHLIHRTLKLIHKNAVRVLAQEEQSRYRRGEREEFSFISFIRERELEVRLISFMGEHGLLQYARRVHISTVDPFTPEILLPHLHYFQSLNRVHTLTIDHFYANRWLTSDHSTGFAHFYPTLTSLTLNHPRNYDLLLNFALQFPNLENLSLQWPTYHDKLESRPMYINIATPERTPPLRGCLRLVGYGLRMQFWMPLFREPPKGFNFRSVELCNNYPMHGAQHALSACARTLEVLTIEAYSPGKLRLQFLPSAIADRFSDPSAIFVVWPYFKLTEMAVLHRLTVRTTFDQLSIQHNDGSFLGMLSTIVSPAFCEFVLELGGSSSLPSGESMEEWGPWGGFDNLFENNFARNRDFRLIIRTSEFSDWEELRKLAEQSFPLLAGRGCIYLETL